MKKMIIIAALSLLAATAFCQSQKLDTSKRILFYQNEVGLINNRIDKALQIIHKMDISALKRDSVDNLLAPIMQVLQRRYQTTMADTSKKKGGKQ